jgi:hypothetical protein
LFFGFSPIEMLITPKPRRLSSTHLLDLEEDNNPSSFLDRVCLTSAHDQIQDFPSQMRSLLEKRPDNPAPSHPFENLTPHPQPHRQCDLLSLRHSGLFNTFAKDFGQNLTLAHSV